jgi:hypothetical protein
MPSAKYQVSKDRLSMQIKITEILVGKLTKLPSEEKQIPSIYPYVFQAVFSLQTFPAKFCTHFSSPSHACYEYSPSDPPRFDHSNNLPRSQTMKLIIMQFFLASCYFLFLPSGPRILLSTPFKKLHLEEIVCADVNFIKPVPNSSQ